MSSAIDNLGDSFSRLNFNSSSTPQPQQSLPWLHHTRQRTSSRNLQIMPSDDEDEDEAIYTSESEDEEEDTLFKEKSIKVAKKVKSSIPLPSDEEDEEDKQVFIYQQRKKPIINITSTAVNTAKPTINNKQQKSNLLGIDPRFLHHEEADDTEHQEESDDDNEVIGNHRNHTRYTSSSSSSNMDNVNFNNMAMQQQQAAYQQQLMYQQQQQQLMYQQQHYQQQQMKTSPQHIRPMSGMDLLIQREQERAEQKRQKPKMNPGQVKIEGLLGKLPEAGSHNINFQHIQQQRQQQQHDQQQHYNHTVPQPSSSTILKKQQQQRFSNYSDFYNMNGGRSSAPPMMMNNNNMMMYPQVYQVNPTYMSQGNLYMMSTQSQPHLVSRPNSSMSQSFHYNASASSSIIQQRPTTRSGTPNEYIV